MDKQSTRKAAQSRTFPKMMPLKTQDAIGTIAAQSRTSSKAMPLVRQETELVQAPRQQKKKAQQQGKEKRSRLLPLHKPH